MSLDPKLFRAALGRFLSGVTVVLVDDEAGLHGMTASAFTSVSLDPPLVLVAVAKKAHMHARLAAGGRFSISLLSAEQEAVSNHFAGRPGPIPEGTITRDAAARPVVAGALAWIGCVLHQAVDAGDHSLFLGRVEGIEVFDGNPLGYWSGAYRRIQ